jgi:hypothetical protein
MMIYVYIFVTAVLLCVIDRSLPAFLNDRAQNYRMCSEEVRLVHPVSGEGLE